MDAPRCGRAQTPGKQQRTLVPQFDRSLFMQAGSTEKRLDGPFVIEAAHPPLAPGNCQRIVDAIAGIREKACGNGRPSGVRESCIATLVERHSRLARLAGQALQRTTALVPLSCGALTETGLPKV
jgi:hypothetical protein